MAKKPIVETAEVVESTALIITQETINSALATYSPIKQELAQIVKEYDALTIRDTKDIAGLAAVTAAYKNVKDICTRVEKIRKAINDAPLTLQRMNNAAAKELLEIGTPSRDSLKAKMDAIEKAVELENRAEESRRTKMLQEAGYQMSGSFWICGPYQIAWSSIMEMSAEKIDEAVKNAALYQQEQAAAAEEKRIADEAAERDRQRKAQELEEKEAKLKAEQEALEKDKADFAAWKAAQAKAAPEPVKEPAPETKTPVPTHAVTVHQKEAPQTIIEHVVVPKPTTDVAAPQLGSVKVSAEFAFGFNTCKRIVVADLGNKELEFSRRGWHDRFAAMEAPATRVMEFIEGYKTLRNLQVKYFRERTPENLTAAKNQEKIMDDLARSL